MWSLRCDAVQVTRAPRQVGGIAPQTSALSAPRFSQERAGTLVEAPRNTIFGLAFHHILRLIGAQCIASSLSIQARALPHSARARFPFPPSVSQCAAPRQVEKRPRHHRHNLHHVRSRPRRASQRARLRKPTGSGAQAGRRIRPLPRPLLRTRRTHRLRFACSQCPRETNRVNKSASEYVWSGLHD